jgi:hypothetical protein
MYLLLTLVDASLPFPSPGARLFLAVATALVMVLVVASWGVKITRFGLIGLILCMILILFQVSEKSQ